MKQGLVWIALLLFTGVVHAQDVSGDWQARVHANGTHRVMLQIVKTSASHWDATLYRIDQGGEPEFATSAKVEESDLSLGFPDGAHYDGKLSADSQTINGAWKESHSSPESVSFQRATKETAWQNLNSDVAPPVSNEDVKIVERAQMILNSPSKWNRADNRECPRDATTFSLYCALDRATVEVSGKFEHRGAAMQEARFVIDDVLAKGNHYDHRLMDYNNDPKTTFADTQEFFRLIKERIQKKLQQGPIKPTAN
jgi:hypothetical protein